LEIRAIVGPDGDGMTDAQLRDIVAAFERAAVVILDERATINRDAR
jgi:hypothetical protein